MTRDELDQEGRERLRRFLDESMRHPTPPAWEGRVARQRARRRSVTRLLGAVAVFAVVAGAAAVVLLVASGGAAVQRHTAGGLTPAPGTAMPSGSASTAYVGTAILSFAGRNWNAGTRRIHPCSSVICRRCGGSKLSTGAIRRRRLP